MKSNRKLLTKLPDSKARIRSRWRQWLLLGVGIYSVVGFFILPAIVKWQLRKQLPALTHRQAEVMQVRMNPFVLSLTVRGLALTETNGAPFAGFDELYVNFQLSSVFRWAWTFREIRLVHPTANLVRLADGSFNFSNLINSNPPPAAKPSTGPPAILIQSLLVTNAVVTFADQATPQPFNATYGPMQLALTDFTTRRAKDGPYTFVATTADGESFSWSGRLTVNPLQSTGEFKLTGISPGKYSPYLAPLTTMRVQRGELDLSASYRMNAASPALELDVANATLELRDLLVKPPESDITLLALNRLTIGQTSVSLTGHVAQVGSVTLSGGTVLAERTAAGRPRVLDYLVPRTNLTVAPAAAPDSTTPMALPWQFNLDKLTVTNFNVAVEDHSTPSIAALGLDDLALTLKGLSNQTNVPLDLVLDFNWRGGGAAHLATRGTLLPPDLKTTLAISNLSLAPLQPYVVQYANLVVHSGGLNLNGAAEFHPAAAPQIRFAGDIGITNFASADTVTYHELAAWENLQIRGIDFTLRTNRLAIEEIKFTGAHNNLVISSNGLLNVSALAKRPSAASERNGDNKEPHELFPIRVGLLTLQSNSFHVADNSLPRHFETHIEEINGTVRDIVLPGANKAEVELRGKVSALAPFEIVGAVTPDPQQLFVDLKVAFTNTDLTPLSAYTEYYAGRPLSKGKLTMELRYNVAQRQLTAQNVIALDHLTLGARNDSPNATKLPVKLAIGLLKDLHGRIDLNLPITGSLDDPKFSIWGLVGQTLENLVLKIATSPFSLLGALAGGGEELQFVEFDAGAATLTESQTNKLVKLAQALAARPALTLEMRANYDAGKDLAALGRQKIMEQMKTLRIQQLVARGKTAPRREELRLDDREYDDLLRVAYKTGFNTTPEHALREALATANGTNAPVRATASSNAASETRKGATSLLHQPQTLSQLNANLRSTPTQASTGKPKTERELVREEMERRLLTTSPVTDDDLRTLMQQRIEAVQTFLAGPGGVAADRLTPAALRLDDPAIQRAARVDFSLE